MCDPKNSYAWTNMVLDVQKKIDMGNELFDSGNDGGLELHATD